ncbi:MAG: polyphenol oxidase family protein [Acidimicrobiales bacterium]
MSPAVEQPAVRLRPVATWDLPGEAKVVCTGWGQGDMSGDTETVLKRRHQVVDLPWTVLDQVHGSRVVTVEEPGAMAGEPADAAVTCLPGVALGVLSADCAPVAMSSAEGVIGIAHAGWRGLRAGVVESTVQSMRRLGATRIYAVLGPCIHPCCYTFSRADLAEVEARLGCALESRDSRGEPSLDLPAGVGAALRAAGAFLVGASRECTAHSAGLWSWRAQSTQRRQATVIWRV